MAEIDSSAVVQETVSQILSGIVQKYEEKEESNASRNLERLEMAQSDWRLLLRHLISGRSLMHPYFASVGS
jgi:hypothetical protein